ncbi:hypothetical protein [Actinoplanes awajinensis]|uniref:Uncharacterized protein n=1 Tax=Actinoplanes awajinensis subsp. mycoplanecinus TaxID=135947 RepID=A0A101J9M2_9ACTN|nr:hypothetical protein [Actinoplanes awajinensis]KUL22724.1 hypothetical protein ADL15_47535 [Actinoplanes awajinensis subsp. mycoplanecinus]
MRSSRAVTVSALTLALAGAAALTATPAQAVTRTQGAVTVNCGWKSCSYYVSRSATRELNSRLDSYAGVGGAVAGTAVCAAVGAVTAVIGGLICEAGMAVNGAVIRDQIKEAAETHGDRGACFQTTIAHGGLLRWYSTDNGKFCKN